MAVVQELWAKLNPRERFVVYGAGAVVLGWLVGFLLASKDYCSGILPGASCSINGFAAGNAGLFSFLVLILAIVALVVLYLRYAPNSNITWPLPFPQLLLAICGAALVCAVLVFLFQFTYGFSIGDAPIFMWVADVLVIAGGALMAWGAYQEWAPTRTPPGA